METTKPKKENNDQITFRDSELFLTLKKISENNGNSGIGPEARKLLREALENREGSLPPGLTTEKTGAPKARPTESIGEKLDSLAEFIVNMALGQENNRDEEVEEKISKEIEAAVGDHEEKLRSENLMLMLPASIKELFYKVVDYRKQKNTERTENVERLFVLAFCYYVENSWDVFPDGFSKELKKAAKEFLNPTPEQETKIENE